MEGTGRPEYGKVVDICTRDSLRELATPGLLAILAPIAVGFGLGVGPLAGYLAGAIGTGTLMAMFLANSGGAWDNAKKLVEDGNHGGKGSDAHEATIIGDTVGDPFKDTAGPAINPLLKVMNLVSLLIAAAIVDLSVGEGENDVLRIAIALVATAIIAAAVYVSKRRPVAIGEDAREDACAGLSRGRVDRDRPGPAVASTCRPPSSTGSGTPCGPVATRTTGWRPSSARQRTPPCRATRPCPGCGPRPAGRPLETLVRLWLLQAAVDRTDVDRALPGLVDPLVRRRAPRARRAVR